MCISYTFQPSVFNFQCSITSNFIFHVSLLDPRFLHKISHYPVLMFFDYMYLFPSVLPFHPCTGVYMLALLLLCAWDSGVVSTVHLFHTPFGSSLTSKYPCGFGFTILLVQLFLPSKIARTISVLNKIGLIGICRTCLSPCLCPVLCVILVMTFLT